jgi:hypothetical protein
MGESRRAGQRGERSTYKQEVIGHGMRAGQCRGVSAWSSHNGRRGRCSSSTVKASNQNNKRGGEEEIAQHRAHAKQRGSDVTSRAVQGGD